MTQLWPRSENKCAICEDMICGCDYCSVPDSLQSIVGICDRCLALAFKPFRNREEGGDTYRLKRDDPKVVYLLEIHEKRAV